MFCAQISALTLDTNALRDTDEEIELDASGVDLEMLLGDKISQRYLLLFAERFYCSDSVQCVIALRDLRRRLKESDSDSGDTRELVGTYFAEGASQPIQDVDHELRTKLSRAVLVENGSTDSTVELLSQADHAVSKFIASDIVRRFRESDECKELLLVHPRRTMTLESIRTLLSVQLSASQKEALDIWVDAHAMLQKQESLLQRAKKRLGDLDGLSDASPCASARSKTRRLVHDQVQGSLDELFSRLKAKSPLASAMDAAMASLIVPYLAFLDGEHGASARVLAGVQTRLPCQNRA